MENLLQKIKKAVIYLVVNIIAICFMLAVLGFVFKNADISEQQVVIITLIIVSFTWYGYRFINKMVKAHNNRKGIY